MMTGAAWLADSWLFLAGCTGRGRVAPDQRHPKAPAHGRGLEVAQAIDSEQTLMRCDRLPERSLMRRDARRGHEDSKTPLASRAPESWSIPNCRDRLPERTLIRHDARRGHEDSKTPLASRA